MIDTIQVPSEYVELASQWHSGQGDMLYAIASTGTIATGSQRPYNDDENRYMDDAEWIYSLVSSAECDIRHALNCANKSGHEDSELLADFHAWIEEQERICERELPSYA